MRWKGTLAVKPRSTLTDRSAGGTGIGIHVDIEIRHCSGLISAQGNTKFFLHKFTYWEKLTIFPFLNIIGLIPSGQLPVGSIVVLTSPRLLSGPAGRVEDSPFRKGIDLVFSRVRLIGLLMTDTPRRNRSIVARWQMAATRTMCSDVNVSAHMSPSLTLLNHSAETSARTC